MPVHTRPTAEARRMVYASFFDVFDRDNGLRANRFGAVLTRDSRFTSLSKSYSARSVVSSHH